MERCFDPTIPTEIITERNVRIFAALLLFWSIGAMYPLIFWPESYVKMSELEHKRFPDSERYKFDRHLFSNEVYAYLDKFAKFYRHKVSIFKLKLQTFEGRDIKVVRLKMPKFYNTKKKGNIVVLGTMLAPLWDSAAASLDIMHKLCEECNYKIPFLQYYDWYIIPVFNPDGYDFTLHTRDINLPACQSPKNRVHYETPDNPFSCYGVYLDRNFGFHWGESKKVDYSNYCWEGFSGIYPFSENETKAFRAFARSLQKRREPVTMYVQLHGSRNRDDVTYPWRFTTQPAFNELILFDMAKIAVEKVNKKTGSYFNYIQSGRRDLASGLLNDWLMGIMHVLYVFSIEPTYEVTNSTDVPDQQIYIEKVTTILFSLSKSLHGLLSSASNLKVNQANLFILSLLSAYVIICSCTSINYF